MRSSLWTRAVGLLLALTPGVLAVVLNSSTPLQSILDKYWDKGEDWWQARSRGRRAISEADMHLIVDLHNKLRGQVHPPASNMEHMVSGGAARLVSQARSWFYTWKSCDRVVHTASQKSNLIRFLSKTQVTVIRLDF